MFDEILLFSLSQIPFRFFKIIFVNKFLILEFSF